MVRIRSAEVSRGVLLALVGIVLTVLGVAQAIGDEVFLVTLAVVLGALGWAGIRWGTDTVDGRDWRPLRI